MPVLQITFTRKTLYYWHQTLVQENLFGTTQHFKVDCAHDHPELPYCTHTFHWCVTEMPYIRTSLHYRKVRHSTIYRRWCTLHRKCKNPV